MPKMRAKLKLHHIQSHTGNPNETLHFHAVAAKSYPADGSDEDNSYSRFSPSAMLQIQIANPALIGTFEIGQTYYVDFTPAA